MAEERPTLVTWFATDDQQRGVGLDGSSDEVLRDGAGPTQLDVHPDPGAFGSLPWLGLMRS